MMGTLNPAGAAALLAVGILVALHLFGRRRRVIAVSTLFLWRQIPAQPLDRRRFRPDLLFLAALAVALALGEQRARPETAVVVLTDLPRETAGVPPDALAAVDWVQIGATDDNVAVAGLVVDTPPFRDVRDATATVVIRNYGHAE